MIYMASGGIVRGKMRRSGTWCFMGVEGHGNMKVDTVENILSLYCMLILQRVSMAVERSNNQSDKITRPDDVSQPLILATLVLT